jgi:hypothetical protein
MARQEDTCWNCGAAWDYRLAARSPLRVIRGRAAERPDSARRVAQAQHDIDRWADEGGREIAEASTRTVALT